MLTDAQEAYALIADIIVAITIATILLWPRYAAWRKDKRRHVVAYLGD